MAKQIRIGKLEVLRADGSTVALGELSQQERQRWEAGLRQKLTETMSAYYTGHPEEFRRLQGKNKNPAQGGHPDAEQNNTTCRTGRDHYSTPGDVLQGERTRLCI